MLDVMFTVATYGLPLIVTVAFAAVLGVGVIAPSSVPRVALAGLPLVGGFVALVYWEPQIRAFAADLAARPARPSSSDDFWFLMFVCLLAVGTFTGGVRYFRHGASRPR